MVEVDEKREVARKFDEKLNETNDIILVDFKIESLIASSDSKSLDKCLERNLTILHSGCDSVDLKEGKETENY